MSTEPDNGTQDTDPPQPVLEPFTWYAMTARDDNPDCPNYGKTFEIAEAYSNAGSVQIICGVCGQEMRQMTAVLLVPQPEVT